jgi:hypothetical protein
MSIKPWEKYQPNAQIPTPQYPWGSLKNESNLGVGDGTPLDVDWGNDFEAFKQTSFERSGIVPSGNPDTVENSEMFNAMQDSITREIWRRSITEIGYDLVAGSFEDGAVVTLTTDVIWFKKENKIYKWVGSLPKTIPSSSTPSTTGGVSPSGDWVDVGDASVYSRLINELIAPDGSKLSLSQVATAYCIPFASLFVWKQGLVSDTSKYWLYDNKVWQSSTNGHVLEAVPTFATAHTVPVDGVLYPDHFGASYIPGVDQTPAIQRCEDWQKARNAPLRLRTVEHTLLTKLVITRAPCIIAEAGGYGVTTMSPASSTRRPAGAVLVGKVAGDFSVVISPALFEFGGQIENVAITGKASPTDTKTTGKGIRLHNFGWSARVKGLSVLDFNGKGLEIGYLQDTVFEQFTVLGCGPTSAQRALSFTSNSNYLYFNNSHIEDGNYLIGCSEATDKPWEIHWNGCHFESGDYDGALGPEFDHSYTSSPVEFDGCYRWYSPCFSSKAAKCEWWRYRISAVFHERHRNIENYR